MHARLGELRARAAAAEREADQAKLGFLFEMRFDQAVREGKASEAERSVWRQAYDEDPGAVRDMLGFTWAGRAS